MPTIKPIKVGGDPVKIVGEERRKEYRAVLIVCGENREHHRLTIKGKHVTIHDHTPEEIQEDYLLKDLHLNAASECVRVKIWGEEGDFEIVPY